MKDLIIELTYTEDPKAFGVMPAFLKRASIVFLDSPVKPGNDGGWVGDAVIIKRPLIRPHKSRSEIS